MGTLKRRDVIAVEAGPERDQPDRPRRAGKRGSSPGGVRCGGCVDFPFSRRMGLKYPVYSTSVE